MIQQNYALKTINGLNITIQRRAPHLKKAKTVPQQMMEDFLKRQQIYEKINRPYVDRTDFSEVNQQSHKFKDIVQEARQKLAESSMRQSQVLKKKENIEKITEVMRKEKQERKLSSQPKRKEQKQLEIWILIVIIIPLVFVLTVLFELM